MLQMLCFCCLLLSTLHTSGHVFCSCTQPSIIYSTGNGRQQTAGALIWMKMQRVGYMYMYVYMYVLYRVLLFSIVISITRMSILITHVQLKFCVYTGVAYFIGDYYMYVRVRCF